MVLWILKVRMYPFPQSVWKACPGKKGETLTAVNCLSEFQLGQPVQKMFSTYGAFFILNVRIILFRDFAKL